jgi:iron complex outermembrane receptor protein
MNHAMPTSPRARSPRPSSRPWIVASALAAAAGSLVPGAAAQPNATRTSALNGRTVDEPGRVLPDLASLGLALSEAPGPVRTYAIAEGPLSDVLATLGREAGVAIEVRNETIGGLTSPGVKGTFTLQQALVAALEGTGHTSRITSPTTVVVE